MIFEHQLKNMAGHLIIKKIEEALINLKRKEETLKLELEQLANNTSNIHQKLTMPIKYDTIDNPSQEGNMADYDSVPKFVPNSNFELTWHNLVLASEARLSQEGFKQILSYKLFGEAAEYFDLYRNRSIEQLVTILTNRFGTRKSPELFLAEIEDFQRPKGQSLNMALEKLK